MELRARLNISHPKLLEAISAMEGSLESPMSCADLAETVGLSPRQLERLFRKLLNESPTRYYLGLRLDRARYLLLQTSLSILNVALACGFVSASHFSKCYREYFGRAPSDERRRIDPATETAMAAAPAGIGGGTPRKGLVGRTKVPSNGGRAVPK
jgi:transcriptional regulator GlxA family with amidase domain